MKSKDISVVIQGLVNDKTLIEIKSIRKYLPNAEIILSTWDDCNIADVKQYCDKIVKSSDPGAVLFNERLNKTNSINRIIVSSKKGVELATRKYILRLRSDLKMVNDNILHFKDNFPCRDENITLFKNRIFAYELFSMKYEEQEIKKYHSAWHISDWCLFGLAEDIKKFHDNLLPVEEPEFSTYFLNYPEEYNKTLDIWYNRKWRMSPEQYMISENAKVIFSELHYKHRLDFRPEVLEASDRFIVNNFIIKSAKQWGIESTKSMYKDLEIRNFRACKNGAWLGQNWLLDYQKYCDKNYILPFKYIWRDDLHLPKYLKKFSKQWKRFFYPFKILIDAFCGLLGVIYYLLHILINLIRFSPKLIFKTLRRINHDT